jgi:sugar lactone lactonase YvrE
LQLAEGLSFAHRSGIIHRDLKPANILLAADDRVCLADFGLARTLFNDSIVEVESRHGEGTAQYMSPAVAAGEAEDTRCDIYAFGALLYEMLTGQPPYQGRTTKEILRQILAGPPKPIATVNPKADRALAAVAEGAMARELRDRYAEIRDVLADLQRVKAGQPPLGPHGADRDRRSALSWPPRWPATLLALGCLAGLITLGWLFSREHPKPAPPRPAPPVVVRELLRLQAPWGVAVDSGGNALVADKERCTISRFTPAGGIDLAGLPGRPGPTNGLGANAQFVLPRGIAVDSAGNIFVADSHSLRKVTPTGAVSGFPETTNQIAPTFTFDLPSGVAVDAEGNVFVADRYTIRKVSPTGAVTTLAGLEGHAGRADGTNAAFSDLEKGLALDAAGNLYVGDCFNHTIRKISPKGVVTSLAGTNQPGSADGPVREARFFKPCGLAVDAATNVIVADSGNNTIRMITPQGLVSTLAGVPGRAGRTDGPAATALFNNPQGVAVDASGIIYITDTGNGMLRQLRPDDTVISLSQPALPGDLRGDFAGKVIRSTPWSPHPALPGEAGTESVALPDGVVPYINLVRAGVGEAVILAYAGQDHNVPYKLTDPQITFLERQGVSGNVVQVLLQGH